MNPFPTPQEKPTGLIVISLVALVVGLVASMALIQRQERVERAGRLPADIRDPVLSGDLNLAAEFDKLRTEVQKLREEKTKLENTASAGQGLANELNAALQDTKAFAGLTEVEGPGVTIILRDTSKKADELLNVNDGIIHDADVVRVINELWNAGAEAITVNNKRAGPTTSYRCVGSVIVVDGARFASPIVIRAIGDSEALYGGLSLPGGVLSELRDTDPSMVSMEPVKKLRFAAFDGSTKFKFASVPEPEPSPEKEEESRS